VVPVDPETQSPASSPLMDAAPSESATKSPSEPVGSVATANTVVAASDDDPAPFSTGDRRFLTWSLVLMTLLLSWHGWRTMTHHARPVEILRVTPSEPGDGASPEATPRPAPIATDAGPHAGVPTVPQNPAAIRLMIDINTAGWHEWTQLPGIGDTLAQRIVADRQAYGPFRTIDDLTRVKGIGEKTLEKLRPYMKPVVP
jgi:competence ComEA-like helix-hairpin-helix protein